MFLHKSWFKFVCSDMNGSRVEAKHPPAHIDLWHNILTFCVTYFVLHICFYASDTLYLVSDTDRVHAPLYFLY